MKFAKPIVAVLAIIAMLPALLLLTASSTSASRPGAASNPTSDGVDEVLAHGSELFAWNCAVCHGASGAGLAEAKLAFPADHRDCTRCHRPSNRIVQPLDRPFNDHDMFAIGEPPALHELEGAASATPLAAVATPEAIFAYLVSSMPRYDPGRLSSEEYWALTAHLLELNDRHDEVAKLVGAQ